MHVQTETSELFIRARPIQCTFYLAQALSRKRRQENVGKKGSSRSTRVVLDLNEPQQCRFHVMLTMTDEAHVINYLAYYLLYNVTAEMMY